MVEIWTRVRMRGSALTPANMVCAWSSGMMAHADDECFRLAACWALIMSSPSSVMLIFLASNAIREARSCKRASGGSSAKGSYDIKNNVYFLGGTLVWNLLVGKLLTCVFPVGSSK